VPRDHRRITDQVPIDPHAVAIARLAGLAKLQHRVATPEPNQDHVQHDRIGVDDYFAALRPRLNRALPRWRPDRRVNGRPPRHPASTDPSRMWRGTPQVTRGRIEQLDQHLE
jgi:hypothetical protein